MLQLQLTVQNGAKLLPDVPKGTGGTKSKSLKKFSEAPVKSTQPPKAMS